MTEQEEILLYGKSAKEYAKELVDKYKKVMVNPNSFIVEKAKQCALLCIREMYDLPIYRCWDIKPPYLKKVEQEIDKL